MVAFWPPPRIAHELVLPLENAETYDQLHVTVLYFGKYAELGLDAVLEIEKAVAKTAAESEPFRAYVGGLGRFSATKTSKGKDVFYASVDAPGLVEFRHRLNQRLQRRGVKASDTHGYVPHMTLAYIPRNANIPLDRLAPVRWRMDTAVLNVGHVKRRFRLGETARLRAEGTDNGSTR